MVLISELIVLLCRVLVYFLATYLLIIFVLGKIYVGVTIVIILT